MMLVASLREAMRKQATELEDLRNKLKVAEDDRQQEVRKCSIEQCQSGTGILMICAFTSPTSR